MKCASAVVLAGVLAVVLGASVKTEDGSAGVSPHIIGGVEVKHKNRPYTARLKLTKNGETVRYCGAARLNRYWFITAAECLDKEKYTGVELVYPDPSKYYDYDTNNFVLSNLYFKIHPQYNNNTKDNNVAAFECYFCSSLPDFNVLPQLPRRREKNNLFTSSNVIVAGWTISNATAATQPNNTITSYNTTMVNPFVCKAVYSFNSVNNGHICASSWGGKKVTESHIGVPLVATGTTSNSRLTLIGIAASVRPWATWLPIPTVFTNIAPVSEWISEVTGIPIRD